MNRGRGESGSLVAVLGGVLLLVSLFLAWYKLANFTVTAWTAFEVWDLVLAALALAVIVSGASHLGYWRGPTHSLGLDLLGLAALVIVASQLIDRPPSVLHSSIGNGGWIGLVGAALMAVGALMAESRVTLSFNAGAGRTPRPGAGPSRTGWRRPPRAPADPPWPVDRLRSRSPAGVPDWPAGLGLPATRTIPPTPNRSTDRRHHPGSDRAALPGRAGPYRPARHASPTLRRQ